MAEWSDRAISLGLRRFGETGAILEVFAREKGRRRGMIYGGSSQKKRAPMQPGNTLAVTRGVEAAIDRLRAQYGAVPVILLTQRDINARERSTRFSFAQHYTGWRVSVISSARLLPGSVFSRASDATIETRLLKFLLRSVGQQVYRLPRDTDIDSVMYSPIMSLSDLDRMGMKLARPGADDR